MKKALKISMKVLMSIGVSIAAIGLTETLQGFIADSILGSDKEEKE